ncbi:MAG: hypothetical protein Phyf2KO_05560 [Phycisphaerales bacterium]
MAELLVFIDSRAELVIAFTDFVNRERHRITEDIRHLAAKDVAVYLQVFADSNLSLSQAWRECVWIRLRTHSQKFVLK